NPVRYKISCLVGEDSKEVLFNCPYIDELLVYDFKDRNRGLHGLWRLATSLRKNNFDIVVDLQNNRRSHIISALSFALHRYGYARKFGFLLNHRIKNDSAVLDPLAHQFRILKMLDVELDEPHLELWPSPQDQLYVDEFLEREWLSARQKLVGINISASQRWQTKNWPTSYITRLCEMLADKNIRVVLTGTEKDSKVAEKLIDAVRPIKPINACGRTTVNQLACLIKRCAVYISSDSAPLHIGVAMGVATIALFGPTDPKRHMVFTDNCILIGKNIACSPCYKSKCQTNICMKSIKPEEVLEAIDKLMR
ncbi:MAG: glycosyltransferase family 9 protein, partial [Candidatus Omnitrophica bacterium]|nr:glycosyltransferase family 9 protein [Candidatus Omnitrophota bacterium]